MKGVESRVPSKRQARFGGGRTHAPKWCDGAYPTALTEATEVDHRYGRIINPSLADYHVPVNADVFTIETDFVEEEDKIINELGVKGMGEVGMIGIPAAIANAVFHATGRRIRDLPITPDKLL